MEGRCGGEAAPVRHGGLDGIQPSAEAAGSSLRLFKRTYDNPKPELTIETLDFISTQAESAPFLVALTVED